LQKPRLAALPTGGPRRKTFPVFEVTVSAPPSAGGCPRALPAPGPHNKRKDIKRVYTSAARFASLAGSRGLGLPQAASNQKRQAQVKEARGRDVPGHPKNAAREHQKTLRVGAGGSSQTTPAGPRWRVSSALLGSDKSRAARSRNKKLGLAPVSDLQARAAAKGTPRLGAPGWSDMDRHARRKSVCELARLWDPIDAHRRQLKGRLALARLGWGRHVGRKARKGGPCLGTFGLRSESAKVRQEGALLWQPGGRSKRGTPSSREALLDLARLRFRQIGQAPVKGESCLGDCWVAANGGK
jgi:hypothetical protein